VRFQCIHCNGIVSIDDTELGQHVGCGHCEEIVQVPTSKFAPQSVIDDFVIERMLGRGGMGIVYKAHQMSLDRPVALKILMNQYSANNDFIIDFIREARAAARLNHPYIVQAYAVGQDEDTYFLAMEFVEGQTLKQIMDVDRTVPLEFALTITIQMAEALGFAWTEQKLIHRDIKPDNIMITGDGVGKLMDLGLSRFDNDKLADTEDEDEVMGTPQYICPEQLIGMPMDVRGDLYSLGATLYHAVTGEFPFQGRNAAEIAKKHLQEPLTPANVHNPSIPPSICKVVEKLMAKHPDDRYPTTQALIKELNQIKANLTSSKRTPKSKSQPIRIKANKTATPGRAGGSTGSFRKTDPSGTGKNRASRTDKNKASSTGRNRPSRTDKNRSGSTGRNTAGSTNKNKATTTGRSAKRSRRQIEEAEDNPRRGRKSRRDKEEEKYTKKSNPAILYGTIAIVCIFAIFAIILMVKD
jgi:serine/threonine protein kinase